MLSDTASFSHPDMDDDELAKFLAVVVDRTGNTLRSEATVIIFLVTSETCSNVQFFPVITQLERMIDQTGGSFEERIAEERESSNAQIRTCVG